MNVRILSALCFICFACLLWSAFFYTRSRWVYSSIVCITFGLPIFIIVGVRVGFRLTKIALLLWLWIFHKLFIIPILALAFVPGLRSLIEFFVILAAYFWFKLLLLGDSIIRRFLRLSSSSLRHSSGALYSIVNAADPNFQPCGDFSHEGQFQDYPEHYSSAAAVSLANCSRLVYENMPLIQHELQEAGFSVADTRAIHYRNTVGFVARQGPDVVVVFRGTEPLNLMNMFTDLRLGMIDLKTLDDADKKNMDRTEAVKLGAEAEDGHMGRVHFGFVEALRISKPRNRSRSRSRSGSFSFLGSPATFLRRSRSNSRGRRRPLQEDSQQNNDTEGQEEEEAEEHVIQLKQHSVWATIKEATKAIYLILDSAWNNLWIHASEPVDAGFTGRSERDVTAYDQASRIIDKLYDPEDGGHVYLTGHSMGGALAMVFYAQAAHQKKSWIVHGQTRLYTYGQPRLGDSTFTNYLSPYEDYMFRFCNNNDIIPRLPPRRDIGKFIPTILQSWLGLLDEPYADPPGHVVFLEGSDGLLKMDPEGGLRGISFLQISGILNPKVIWRMRNETWLRIIFRLLLPFCMNDHICGDYSKHLQVILDDEIN